MLLYYLSTTLTMRETETSGLWSFNEKNIKNIYVIEKILVEQDPHKKTKFLKNLPNSFSWVCYKVI